MSRRRNTRRSRRALTPPELLTRFLDDVADLAVEYGFIPCDEIRITMSDPSGTMTGVLHSPTPDGGRWRSAIIGANHNIATDCARLDCARCWGLLGGSELIECECDCHSTKKGH